MRYKLCKISARSAQRLGGRLKKIRMRVLHPPLDHASVKISDAAWDRMTSKTTILKFGKIKIYSLEFLTLEWKFVLKSSKIRVFQKMKYLSGNLFYQLHMQNLMLASIV